MDQNMRWGYKPSGNYIRKINFPRWKEPYVSWGISQPKGGKAALCSDTVTAGLTGWEASCIFNEMSSSDAFACLFTQCRAWIPKSGTGISPAHRVIPHISSLMAVAGIFVWTFLQSCSCASLVMENPEMKMFKLNVLPPEAPQMWPIIGQPEVLLGTGWSVSTLKWARPPLLSLTKPKIVLRSPKVSLY